MRLPPDRPTLPTTVIAVALMVLTVGVFSPLSARAQDEPVPTPTSSLVITESDADPAIEPGSPVGEIIPQPNSGARPVNAGDRGGWQQLTLFVMLLVFLAVGAWRVGFSGRAGRRAYHAQTAHAGDADATTDERSDQSPR